MPHQLPHFRQGPPKGKKAKAGEWDAELQQIRGGEEKDRIINNRLADLKLRLEKIYDRMDSPITPQRIKAELAGTGTKHITLSQMFDVHFKDLAKTKNKPKTNEGEEIRGNNIMEFVASEKKKKDIFLHEIKEDFARDLESYLSKVKEFKGVYVGRHTEVGRFSIVFQS